MHSVERSPEPPFIAAMQAAYSQWDDLNGDNRRRIREALRADFGQCCAYCENECRETGKPVGNSGTIDHFRPRSRFPKHWLAWLNLVYACRRCNDTKGNLWPKASDDVNLRLSCIIRYCPVSEYVNPSATPDQRAAQKFFEFHSEDGRIEAARHLEPNEWSMSYRTIADLDLNSDYQGTGDGLPYLRRERLDFIIQKVGNPLADPDIGQMVSVLREFMQPDKPFSSFVRAYVFDRFPLFREFFR